MTTRTAYLSAEGYEDELKAELDESFIAQYGRVFLADSQGPRKLQLLEPAWSVNSWLSPVEITIRSIGDAATQLRSKGKLWALNSYQHHRRAQLIQDQLPKLKPMQIDFLAPCPVRELGSWTLLSENLVLASAQCTSPFENGMVAFHENKSAPSRAYLKLWELFTIYGVRPKPGERCLDLGACPGGWTWVLATLGCEVLAIDRSELDPKIMTMKGVTFRKGNALTLKPKDIGAIDWLFSDVICYPEQLLGMIEAWVASGLCRNLVCTVKLKGKMDFEVCHKLAQIPGARLKHLTCNKHELTWWVCAATIPSEKT